MTKKTCESIIFILKRIVSDSVSVIKKVIKEDINAKEPGIELSSGKKSFVLFFDLLCVRKCSLESLNKFGILHH